MAHAGFLGMLAGQTGDECALAGTGQAHKHDEPGIFPVDGSVDYMYGIVD